MSEIDVLLSGLKKYGNAGRDCALSAEDALTIAAALEAAREDAERAMDGLQYAALVWVLSDEIEQSPETVDSAVRRMIRGGEEFRLSGNRAFHAIDQARGKGWRMRDVIGKPVRIEWRKLEDDWPTFTVLAYDPPMLHLQGRDDGRWKHDGGSFWVNVSEIVSIVPEQGEE